MQMNREMRATRRKTRCHWVLVGNWVLERHFKLSHGPHIAHGLAVRYGLLDFALKLTWNKRGFRNGSEHLWHPC